MKAGQRTAWIELYASAETTGAGGDPQASWADAPEFSVWARKRNLTQRETVTAGALQQDDGCVFDVLHLEGITTKHRIKYAGRYFDITGINDPDERHEMLHLYAREGVSYGS